jgi:hypothetical protein
MYVMKNVRSGSGMSGIRKRNLTKTEAVICEVTRRAGRSKHRGDVDLLLKVPG